MGELLTILALGLLWIVIVAIIGWHIGGLIQGWVPEE